MYTMSVTIVRVRSCQLPMSSCSLIYHISYSCKSMYNRCRPKSVIKFVTSEDTSNIIQETAEGTARVMGQLTPLWLRICKANYRVARQRRIFNNNLGNKLRGDRCVAHAIVALNLSVQPQSLTQVLHWVLDLQFWQYEVGDCTTQYFQYARNPEYYLFIKYTNIIRQALSLTVHDVVKKLCLVVDSL